MSDGQAKKGGQVGKNGEWYEGGQFLPSSENTIKGAQSKATVKKGTKQQVAPYTWEPAPYDDAMSIFDRIDHFCSNNQRECKYEKGKGFIGFKLVAPFPTRPSTLYKDYDYDRGCFKEIPHSQEHLDYISGLIEKYNSGQKWFPLSEDRYHYKNNQ